MRLDKAIEAVIGGGLATQDGPRGDESIQLNDGNTIFLENDAGCLFVSLDGWTVPEPKQNIKWAEQMGKEGKITRRPCWAPGLHLAGLKTGGLVILDSLDSLGFEDGPTGADEWHHLTAEDCLATDYELAQDAAPVPAPFASVLNCGAFIQGRGNEIATWAMLEALPNVGAVIRFIFCDGEPSIPPMAKLAEPVGQHPRYRWTVNGNTIEVETSKVRR